MRWIRLGGAPRDSPLVPTTDPDPGSIARADGDARRSVVSGRPQEDWRSAGQPDLGCNLALFKPDYRSRSFRVSTAAPDVPATRTSGSTSLREPGGVLGDPVSPEISRFGSAAPSPPAPPTTAGVTNAAHRPSRVKHRRLYGIGLPIPRAARPAAGLGGGGPAMSRARAWFRSDTRVALGGGSCAIFGKLSPAIDAPQLLVHQRAETTR